MSKTALAVTPFILIALIFIFYPFNVDNVDGEITEKSVLSITQSNGVVLENKHHSTTQKRNARYMIAGLLLFFSGFQLWRNHVDNKRWNDGKCYKCKAGIWVCENTDSNGHEHYTCNTATCTAFTDQHEWSNRVPLE